MFKNSSVLFLFVFFLIFLSQCDCVVKRGIWDTITKPFRAKEKNSDPNAVLKEHGNLDNIGRDVIRETTKTVTTIENEISSTLGLDVLFKGSKSDFLLHLLTIYPGTKWCGNGNIADSKRDLGTFSTTDSCCRDHDNCKDNIAAGSTKYNLRNTGLFTRSLCKCDTKFHDCLKKANDPVATSIGFTYFTILGPQCFKKDYPILKCAEKEKFGRCLNYSLDKDGKKRYQWFDNPVF